MRKVAIVLLFSVLTCAAQDSKLQDIDRMIAEKEKELAELKVKRAKLVAASATPQERAMWADPLYVKSVTERERLKPQLEALRKRDEQVCKERELAGQASGMNAADFGRTAQYEQYSAQLRALRAQADAAEAKIAAAELDLMKLRQKYGVPEPKKK